MGRGTGGVIVDFELDVRDHPTKPSPVKGEGSIGPTDGPAR